MWDCHQPCLFAPEPAAWSVYLSMFVEKPLSFSKYLQSPNCILRFYLRPFVYLKA